MNKLRNECFCQIWQKRISSSFKTREPCFGLVPVHSWDSIPWAGPDVRLKALEMLGTLLLESFCSGEFIVEVLYTVWSDALVRART